MFPSLSLKPENIWRFDKTQKAGFLLITAIFWRKNIGNCYKMKPRHGRVIREVKQTRLGTVKRSQLKINFSNKKVICQNSQGAQQVLLNRSNDIIYSLFETGFSKTLIFILEHYDSLSKLLFLQCGMQYLQAKNNKIMLTRKVVFHPNN